MEKIFGENVKKIAQKLLAIFLIFATVISYFPANVFAEDETNDEFNPENLLTVNWSNGTNTIEGYSNSAYGFYCKIETSTRGISNVAIEITTDNEENCSDTVSISGAASGNGFVRKTYENLNSGMQISSTGAVRFGNKITRVRTVTIKLTGKYVDSETNATKSFTVKREITANIIPYKKEMYSSKIEWNPGRNISCQTQNAGVYDDVTRKIKHPYVGSVTMAYPIYISSGLYTKKLELHVVINRRDLTNNGNSKSGMPVDDNDENSYEIYWGGLDLLFGNPTKNILDDGSVEYIFTKEQNANDLNVNDTFNISKSFIVTAIFNTPNTNPQIEDYVSSTTISFDSTLYGTGLDETIEYGKDDLIEKKTIESRINNSKNILLVDSIPYGRDNGWLTYNYQTGDVLTLEEIDDIKNNKSVQLSTYVGIYNYVLGNYNSGDAVLGFSKPVLRYISDDGKCKSIILNSNQIRLDKIKAYKIRKL